MSQFCCSFIFIVPYVEQQGDTIRSGDAQTKNDLLFVFWSKWEKDSGHYLVVTHLLNWQHKDISYRSRNNNLTTSFVHHHL